MSEADFFEAMLTLSTDERHQIFRKKQDQIAPSERRQIPLDEQLDEQRQRTYKYLPNADLLSRYSTDSMFGVKIDWTKVDLLNNPAKNYSTAPRLPNDPSKQLCDIGDSLLTRELSYLGRYSLSELFVY